MIGLQEIKEADRKHNGHSIRRDPQVRVEEKKSIIGSCREFGGYEDLACNGNVEKLEMTRRNQSPMEYDRHTQMERR